MNATPPEAKPEYSRAPTPSERHSQGPAGPSSGPGGSVPVAVLLCGLLGAALLAISEFIDVYQVHVPTSRAAIKSVAGGSHNAYAFIPIAVLALLLAYGAARERSRPALLALGALGVISLLIALIGDLPDAQSSGLVLESGRFFTATANPAAGMYLETLGAVVLLIGSGVGLLLGGTPRTSAQRRRPHRTTPPGRPSGRERSSS